MKKTAIILAAGKGKRMNSSTKKQYMELLGKPVLYYSVKAFEDSVVDEIIIVCSFDDREYIEREIVRKYGFKKVSFIVGGGKERYNSVMNGLNAIGSTDYVFIHDGVRPLVTPEIINKAYDTAVVHKSAVVGMPVKDTIKIVDKSNNVMETPNRNNVWLVQTPQVFAYSPITDAYEDLIASETSLTNRGIKITDDAMVLETFGSIPIKLVEGSYENIKITTPDDMTYAESILIARNNYSKKG